MPPQVCLRVRGRQADLRDGELVEEGGVSRREQLEQHPPPVLVRADLVDARLVQHVRAWLPATRQLSWRDTLKAGVQQEDREGPLWRALPGVRALAATLAAGGAPTEDHRDAFGYFKHSVQARGGEIIPLLNRSDVVAKETPGDFGNHDQFDAIELVARLMWLKNGVVDHPPIGECGVVELIAHSLLRDGLYARVITEEEAIEQGLPYE